MPGGATQLYRDFLFARDLAHEVAAPDAARAQLESLLQPDSLVVFAGQQPGLYTAPFGSDDHDFAEVDHVQLPVAGRLETLRYVPATAPNGAPLGRIALDPGMFPHNALLFVCPDHPLLRKLATPLLARSVAGAGAVPATSE